MIGVYLIKCKSNDKIYIGQSLNIKHRINEHKSELRKNRHSNSHLQNAFNKYGEEQFEFKVLYEMPKEEYTKEKLNQIEIEYIANYQSNIRERGFNIESGGNGAGRSSKETCEKISQKLKGNHNNANAWLGKHHSEETKKLLSEQRKGKPSHLRGKTQSEEHINKKIESQLGRVWVYKGNNSRFVSNETAQQLLGEGYIIGRPFQKRVKGKKHEYNGGFYTIPQIAQMCGIDKSIIFGRIRRGWSIEQATATRKIAKDDKKGKHLYNGEYLNLTYISKLVGIDYEILRSRLRRGMSLDEAIAKPVKKRNQ